LDQPRLGHSTYLIIEGAIGVGKTTLTRMLRDHFGANEMLEVFEENPFLSKFYESRARYAFQTQMFFLLSRYRQQQQQVPELLARGAMVADYMFAKDRLFARLNLAGDEWAVYEQLHEALAEQVTVPDLVVYLQASTDTLMTRIAQRDRPYERDMDRAYIDQLRGAYERYFDGQHGVPILRIDTDPLNFVARRDDFLYLADRIEQTLKENGTIREPLPTVPEGEKQPDLRQGQSLADYQQFHVELDRIKNFHTDVYFNYLCLSEEIGELGSELANLWREEHQLRAQGHSEDQAKVAALAQCRPAFESELADCMAYLLKLANYAGINLETAYLKKMTRNQDRTWSR
jgi:deoxyguanosine kinase